MPAFHESQIQRCESQLRDFFNEVMQGATADFAQQRVEDKWSTHENLAHLARYHEIFLDRLHRILTEINPVFSRYRAEEDPEWEAWRVLPGSEVTKKLASLREKLVLKLKMLHAADFERTGIHPSFGDLTLSQWLEFFLIHEGHHLYLVFQQVRSGK